MRLNFLSVPLSVSVSVGVTVKRQKSSHACQHRSESTLNFPPKSHRAISMGLACLLSSLAAHAAIDPRFKSEAMPEGTRLDIPHTVVIANTVVNELKSTTELTSPTAAQCLAIRSKFNGQRIHLRLQANTFAMTKIPPFDDVREELWSRFVVEEEPSCSGWVMMSRTLGAGRRNSVLDNWKRFVVTGSSAAQDAPSASTDPLANDQQRQLQPQAKVALKLESDSAYCANGPQVAHVQVLKSQFGKIQLAVLDGPCIGVTGFVGVTALVPLKPKM